CEQYPSIEWNATRRALPIASRRAVVACPTALMQSTGRDNHEHEQALPLVHLYSDGSCKPNPGAGGWAAVLISPDSGQRRELSGAVEESTNNRMELTAAIMGLRALKRPCRVIAHTDSRYLRDAFEAGWLERWQQNGWRTADKKPVVNQDLWEEL